MNENYIYAGIKKSIEKVNNQTLNISLNTKVVDLGFDSLDAVECVMEIEKELNIVIPDAEAFKFLESSSTGDISYLVNKIHSYVNSKD